MTKQSLSDRQRKWLFSQIDDWKSKGLLSEDQVARVLDLYESPGDLLERHRSKAIFTLMGIAALLVGLGALLLVGYNWEKMPQILKLAIILGAIIGTHATAFYLRFVRHSLLLSEVVFFLGCFLYGIGIFLVAQIFNYNSHYPDGVWWWAVGVLPFAICLDTVLLHAAFVALVAIWCGMEVLDFPTMGAWFFGRWQYIPNGAYSALLLAVPGFLWAYRNKSIAALYLYVPLVAWWLILQPFAWQTSEGSHYFVGGVGSLLLVIAEMHPSGSRYAIPYRLYGTLVTAGVLVLTSFYGFNEEFSAYTHYFQTLFQAIFLLLLAIGTISVFALTQRRVSGFGPSQNELFQEIRRRQIIPIGLLTLMIALMAWHSLKGGPWLPTILCNIAMVSIAFWLMSVGLREDRGRPFAGGVLYFLIWSVCRYIDLFGDFAGMLGAALMFFICGVALFGFALFWRDRKRRQHG